MRTIDFSTNDTFTPFVKFDARSGRLTVRHGDQDVEISKPTFVFDMAHIQTGWIAFVPGEGPKEYFDTDEGRQPRPEAIGEIEFKRGFKVQLFGDEPRAELDGEPLGLRDFSSTAMAVRRSLVDRI